MKTAILFDLDGTLLDTLQDLTDAVNYALSQYDCPARTPREIRSYLGNGAKQLMALSLPEGHGLDVDAVLATYRAYYDAHCQVATKPYGGVVEALASLSQKYAVAVVSNKPDSAVKPLCRQYFGDIYALGETADCPRKPAPDMLHRAKAALGADHCVYVGDSEVDVLTAKNAGCPCVAVTWGFRDEPELIAAGAQYLCHRGQDLPEIIETILGEAHG